MKQEIGVMSPRTRYRVSFVESFGYKCSIFKNGDTRLNDEMRIVDGDRVFHCKRKNLLDFLRRRHEFKYVTNIPKFNVLENSKYF